MSVSRPQVGAAAAGRQRAVATLLSGLAGVVATAGVLGVTAAAFALSFDAIRAVAVAAHIRPSLAWLYPVAVDGAMATATVCAVVLRARGRSAAYPWLVVLFGAVVSVVANGLHAWVGESGVWLLPAVWAVTLSAVPPVLLALSVHLLIVLALSVRPNQPLSTPDDTTRAEQQPAPAPAAAGSDSRPASTTDRPAAEKRRVNSATPRKRPTAAQRVAKAVADTPDASAAEIAARLKVSERTVQRYRPQSTSDNSPATTHQDRPADLFSSNGSTGSTGSTVAPVPAGAFDRKGA